MAHEISIRSDGSAEAMYALKPAWHGLGTVLPHVPNSEEAMKAAHLDWSVAKIPLFGAYVHSQAGEMVTEAIQVPEQFATIREDTRTILGIVAERYQVVQNLHAFDFLDSLLQDGVIKYEAAGALRGGQKIWVLARMPSYDTIADNDTAMRYVLFASGHDGKNGIYAIPTSVRVVCANTLAIATEQAISFSHTGDIAGKMMKARKMISQFDEKFTLFRDKARRLAETKMTAKQREEYISHLFPTPEVDGGKALTRYENVSATLASLGVNSRNNFAAIRGTFWAAYNTVSEYVDHHATYRGDSNRAREESKMMSVMEGNGAKLKEQAFDYACEMAGLMAD